MALYEGHQKWGIIYSILAFVMGIAVSLESNLAVADSLIIGGGSAVAGYTTSTWLSPDIDHQDSNPRDNLQLLLYGSAAGMVFWLLSSRPAVAKEAGQLVNGTTPILAIPPFLAGAALLSILGFVGAVGAGKTIDEATTHRGITHSWVYSLVMFAAAVVVVDTFATYPLEIVLFVGVISAVGPYVHRMAD